MSTATMQRHNLNARSEIARELPRLSNHLAGMLEFVGITTFDELRAVSDSELTSRGGAGRRLDAGEIAAIRQHLAEYDAQLGRSA